MTWDELQKRLVASMEQPIGFKWTRAAEASELAGRQGLIQLTPRADGYTYSLVSLVILPGQEDPAVVVAAIAALWRLLNPPL